jgi:hypothetical protein
MAFDYKKEYKEFYMPKNKPSIISVPKMNYIAVRGSGNPNAEDGEYKKAIDKVRILTYLGKLDYRDLCGIERAAVVNIKAERRRRKRRNGNETGSAHMGKK